MGIINKIFSSVNGIYNNINPITLSGVNDVIVVRGEDGVLRCSPFQLRLSKLKFYNSKDKVVHLYVNGELTEISMTITSVGDLYFAQEKATDDVDYEKVLDYMTSTEVGINSILSSRLACIRDDSHSSHLRSVLPFGAADDMCLKEQKTYSLLAGSSPGRPVDLDSLSSSQSNLDIPSNPNGQDCQDDSHSHSNNETAHSKSGGDTEAVGSVSTQNTESVVGEIEKETPTLCAQHNGSPTPICRIEHRDLEQIRADNLNLRLFAKNNVVRYANEQYAVLQGRYYKMGTLLNSAEHYASLLEKQKLLLFFLGGAISNKSPQEGGSSITFSACLNNKIIGSIDETFSSYLVKEIEDPANTVVKIEGVLWNRTGDSKKQSPSKDRRSFTYQRNFRFFLPFMVFTRLFFELRQARHRSSKLVEFLEKRHNSALGWNFFGLKQPIKSDISFSLELESKELGLLKLRPGKNDVVFKISGQPKQLEGNIYLWEHTDKIIVSDVDGTITKSDILGHLYNFVGKDWTHHGVASLFTKMVQNKYKILYLTARALGQSSVTRSYLKAIDQDSFTLPDGPVILSPDGLFGAFYREVIVKRPEDFKIHCLQKIRKLFIAENPFFAGFGNRVSDVYTYKMLGIPDNKIYTINPEGKLLAEYTQSLIGTYHTMNDFVDSIFPNREELQQDEEGGIYSDFAWWKSTA